MPRDLGRRILIGLLVLWGVGPLAANAWAAPTAEQALKLRPVQKDVEHDVPTAEEAKAATIKAENVGKTKGWVIRNPAGQILRRFVDTNGDNVVDRWSYYKDGLEVYRDIDRNYNGKADEHRWLNTGGTRWGGDSNEDGAIDNWKRISAEEASAEAVQALAQRDSKRFKALLLTSSELKSLGLDAQKTKQLSDKSRQAVAQIDKIARGTQKLVSMKTGTKWVHFGASRPGIVPAGTHGLKKDLAVYENVIVVVETDGKHDQLQLGTVIQVGDVWRLVDLPQRQSNEERQVAQSGIFFQVPLQTTGNIPQTGQGQPDAKMQELLSRLEKLDEHNPASTPAQIAKSHEQRSNLLLELADSSGAEDRGQWLRQLADTLSAAAQSGEYPAGVKRLETLKGQLKAKKADADLLAYYEFRWLTADYAKKLQAPNEDFAKVQDSWLESLEKYVEKYPKSSDTPEAMLQLAMAKEFAGQDEAAKKWYGQIARRFTGSSSATKATGAARRLDSVGKSITLKGTAVDGKPVDLARHRGKVVLVHYWATWCEPCKVDLAQLKELQARYGKSGFTLIGVSLDSDKSALASYLKTNRLPWPQLCEPGGLDSRLANEMGILNLPTMILIDKKGKVANRNIHVTQLESELKTHLR